MKALRKGWTTALLALVLVLAIAGCGNNNEQEGEQQSSGIQTPTVAPSENAGEKSDLQHTTYPLTVVDATGESFTFEAAPQKIISVSPAETEILFELGLNEQIVGVSDFDDYPQAALDKPKMGAIYEPNVESMIAAESELVFTGVSMNEEAVKKLRDLGIIVFKTDPRTLDDVLSNIELFGQITDKQAEASAVVERMKQERDEVTQAVQSVSAEDQKKVYIEFSPGWTVGKGEFMDELITLAGGVNVAADLEGWSQISEERIIQDNPDVILYSSNVVDDQSGMTLDEIIKGRPGWDQITAVKNGAVIAVDDNLLSRPGPRLTLGLKEIAKAIYPELF